MRLSEKVCQEEEAMEGEMHYLGDRKSNKGNKLGSLEKQTNFTNFLAVPANHLACCVTEEAGEERDCSPLWAEKGWVAE